MAKYSRVIMRIPSGIMELDMVTSLLEMGLLAAVS